jgi:hypothetical protein
VKWILGESNSSDLFTKNLAGPLFEKHMATYCGEWQVAGVRDSWILNGRVSQDVIEGSRVRHELSARWHSGSVSCSESVRTKMTKDVLYESERYMEKKTSIDVNLL